MELVTTHTHTCFTNHGEGIPYCQNRHNTQNGDQKRIKNCHLELSF